MGILGVGEAGGRISEDLVAAGVVVRAWDPARRRLPWGVERASGPADAVASSEVVLSLTSPAAALEAAESSLPGLRAGTLYADLNSASPALKRELARRVEAVGALFTDVALIAPVPRAGLHTPALASGSGADAFARRFRALGMPVEVVEGGAGAAATRKLVRSVFMKGLAAAALESVEAAAAAGCEAWVRAEIAAVLDGPGQPLLERLLAGSARHASRRTDEMRAARELLRELGVDPAVTEATIARLASLGAAGERGGAR